MRELYADSHLNRRIRAARCAPPAGETVGAPGLRPLCIMLGN